jgi:hypothetical protein
MAMGVWGIGTFDNDDAINWGCLLCQSTSTLLLVATLEAVSGRQRYVEAPECSMALAAAEVVAALRGSPDPALPDNVRRWVARNPVAVDIDLLMLARSAIERIRRVSGLNELWRETEDYDDWQSLLENLLRRLGVSGCAWRTEAAAVEFG